MCYVNVTILTSIWAPDKHERSKQQLERLAPAKSALRKFAILKFMYRKSRRDKSAPSKLIPWKQNTSANKYKCCSFIWFYTSYI